MQTIEINIPINSITLQGELVLPIKNAGLIIFAHGSGSSRFSPRNLWVAKYFQDRFFGTLMLDLLTIEEDRIFENRFDIDLLTQRLIEATKWLMKNDITRNLPIAYFGASTGAASALGAAAFFGDSIKAVVSRGGRPDLVLTLLPKVKSPTLLLVGGLDRAVIEMNKLAFDELKTEKELKIISGASHLFEEPGKLGEVANEAVSWFKNHLVKKGKMVL
jgi:dienelactone hydrolase